MMLRPRWIGALLFALALAAGFAALGQWQLERAIESGKAVVAPTESVLPLAQVAKPNGPMTDKSVGQLVEFTGTFVAGDEQLLYDRINFGKTGWWVVSHVDVDGGDGHRIALAVARGWAPDEATAKSVMAQLAEQPEAPQKIVGRLLPDEQPQVPDDKKNPTAMKTVGVGQLYNLWTGVDGMDVYNAYVVDRTPAAGLDTIDSPPPIQQAELNWLNVFYAAEWIIFAGFAIFLWYRLVRDAKQREDEERELAAEAAAGSGPGDGARAHAGNVE
ncbi:SURF1 family cytochrome oxidase biogenesis protein [Leifsonia sp. L25]